MWDTLDSRWHRRIGLSSSTARIPASSNATSGVEPTQPYPEAGFRSAPNNDVDIGILLLTLRTTCPSYVFLSQHGYDHTTLRGSLPTNGMAKEGTWVYIGPADDDKGALKLLNLKSLKTTETASAIIQDDFARSRIDELTEYDRVGAIGTSHPSTADQVRRSFDLSGNPEFMLDDDTPRVTAALQQGSPTTLPEEDGQSEEEHGHPEEEYGQFEEEHVQLDEDHGSITAASDSDEPHDDDETMDNERVTATSGEHQADHAGDISLRNEMQQGAPKRRHIVSDRERRELVKQSEMEQ